MGRASHFVNKGYIRFGGNPLATAVLRNGTMANIDLRSMTEFRAYYSGEYDSELIGWCLRLFDVNRLFIDVGANVGFYTTAIAKEIERKSGSGQVYGYEPHPENYKRLTVNVEQNDLSRYCRIFNFGLSDADCTTQLVQREDFSMGSLTGNASIEISPNFDKGFTKILIELHSLDSLVKKGAMNGKTVDFIKIDIEGHEDYFLRGAREMLHKQRPSLLLEVNKAYYAARGTDFSNLISIELPEAYRLFRHIPGVSTLLAVESLDECQDYEDVFAIPREKAHAICAS
tara:strand:- start:155 stop:1012 length:858 start_codon:yes stop_codon:yes gene_type:complete